MGEPLSLFAADSVGLKSVVSPIYLMDGLNRTLPRCVRVTTMDVRNG
jgi:hypothetical protein